MAVYTIGDIHGCLTSLKALFDNHSFTKDDIIVFLGDYIDRGPNSKGVIDWLIEKSKPFNFTFIKGNHDIMMLTARSDKNELFRWVHFGGEQTLDSYDIGGGQDWAKGIPDSHWGFIENGRPYYEYGDFIFVHAGLLPKVPLHQQTEHDLFWKKYEKPKQYQKNKTVICGHTSRKNGEIANFGHTICIDTYCYGGMWLSCLNVENLEYIRANEKGEVEFGKL